jgi:hypothetical protein
LCEIMRHRIDHGSVGVFTRKPTPKMFHEAFQFIAPNSHPMWGGPRLNRLATWIWVGNGN